MEADESADPQLSYAATIIKISSLDWKIGEKNYSYGVTAVEK